jgi:hypothetical protein
VFKRGQPLFHFLPLSAIGEGDIGGEVVKNLLFERGIKGVS